MAMMDGHRPSHQIESPLSPIRLVRVQPRSPSVVAPPSCLAGETSPRPSFRFRRSLPSSTVDSRSVALLLRLLFPSRYCAVLDWRGAEIRHPGPDLDRLLPLPPGFVEMGLFKGSFTLLVGMGCGVYIAQNYNVPNIKKLFNTYVFLAKHIEETYRKPKKDDD